MIYLTRMDKSEILLNALLIERIERTPDTVVTLTTGKKVMVRETPDEIMERSVAYLRSLRGGTGAADDGDAQSIVNIAQFGRVTK